MNTALIKILIYCQVLWIARLLANVRNAKHKRIIGGTDVNVGQYPYIVAINTQTETSRFFCGGSLITNQWIFTAGQCVDGAVLFSIQLGSNKLTGDDPYRVTVATSHYVLHPDYDYLTLENDLGFIKLRLPIEFSDNLRSMDNYGYNVVDEIRDMWAIGWGQISDQDPELYNTLQSAEVVPLTNSECQIFYGNQITENKLCIGGNYNEGTCYGDTGGPLIVDLGRGYRSIAAVASFISSNGCESTDPSGYTRVYPYRSWIENITAS